ncbi:phytoene desaturase family protein [Euzebya tangerina]|uniref:phytoene desaturase family protein n=1 Tax=Euzebya tangerina TaxID=591198 RepID=UPI000E312589|nr:NAD(P)/FAD-dependent oxidoreductase [Euzebya tangerina]
MRAIVVGSGPNGLAAAITLAEAGCDVTVLEAAAEPGGATRSAPLVGPGYINDLGSAIHPLAKASPFFSRLDLAAHGLTWITPPAAVGHALDDGRAAVAWNDLDRTAAGLGRDGPAYRKLARPLIDGYDRLLDLIFTPPLRIPPHPVFTAQFGLKAMLPAQVLAPRVFADEAARALFAGHAAHAVMPLNRPFTAAFGLLFSAMPHVAGWPFPRGGAGALATALVSVLEGLGGRVLTNSPVRSMADVSDADTVIFDLTPVQVLRITGTHFPPRYRAALARFRYGTAVFKLDYALSDPIPWTNPDLGQAGTVHVGGSLEEVAASEAAAGRGQHAERPFLILAQHTPFDPTRAPAGKHTCWVYCHVPNGSTVDMTTAIEDQIERFAPGFKDTIITRHATNTVAMEAWNSNLVGGDIGGGAMTGRQLVARPRLQRSPYTTPDPRLFIGSSSAWPGGGVHGMAGHQAALVALDRGLRSLGRLG